MYIRMEYICNNGFARQLIVQRSYTKNIKLPESYSGYSFHSYDTVCLPTDELEPWRILQLRDQAFIDYHTNNKFLDRIKKRFGDKAVKNITEMSKIKLNRKIIDENKLN